MYDQYDQYRSIQSITITDQRTLFAAAAMANDLDATTNTALHHSRRPMCTMANRSIDEVVVPATNTEGSLDGEI